MHHGQGLGFRDIGRRLGLSSTTSWRRYWFYVDYLVHPQVWDEPPAAARHPRVPSVVRQDAGMTEQLRTEAPVDLDQQGDYGQYVQERLAAREQTAADAGRIDDVIAQRRQTRASAGVPAEGSDPGGVEAAIRDRRARMERHDQGRSWSGDQ